MGPIYMNEVKCLGQEKSIWNCPFKNITSEACKHTEDAAVRCNVPYMGYETTVRACLISRLLPYGNVRKQCFLVLFICLHLNWTVCHLWHKHRANHHFQSCSSLLSGNRFWVIHIIFWIMTTFFLKKRETFPDNSYFSLTSNFSGDAKSKNQTNELN